MLWTAHKLRKPLWKRYFIVFAAIVHVNVEWPGNSFLNWLDNSGMARILVIFIVVKVIIWLVKRATRSFKKDDRSEM